tara:strand:+ start:42262 stop:42795 length:534 start_codon:yes stop_codon:yes gene_type:complete
MKLVKTASGKQTIRMSKKEWQSIGKKAGWVNKLSYFQLPEDTSEYIAHARLKPDLGENNTYDLVQKAQVLIIKPNSLERRRLRKFDTMDEAQEWISTQNFTIVSIEDWIEAERNNLDRMNAKRNATIKKYKENPEEREHDKNPGHWIRKWDEEKYEELQNRFRNISSDPQSSGQQPI